MTSCDEDHQKEKPSRDSSALLKLKRRLAELRSNEDGYIYDSEEERVQKTEKAIAIYVKAAIEEQHCSKEFVKRKLKDLFEKDFLIHKEEILQYGYAEIQKFGHVKCTENSPLSEQPIKSQPIFCKENVYHAYLCCEAISKYDHSNIREFFEDKLKPHKIEEVSMSLSNHYLIAKSQNTFIIAFTGEKSFTSWFETCEKQQCGYRFEKGLEACANEVPFRFLVKQLLVEKSRVIFTGFSSGGLIACMVSSLLWKDNSYIGSDELKANTMCLTFGQPIINLQCISELVQKYPEFKATLHQVYLKSDLIPQIFYCAARRQISLVITDKSKLLHYKPFLYYLGELQPYYNEKRPLSQPCEELNKLKEIIATNTSELVMQGDELPFQLFGTQYLINIKNGASWKQLGPESLLKELGPLKFAEIEGLTCEALFKNHNIQEVFSSVFAGYLDRPPQLKITDPASSVKDVAPTKPVPNSIAFHRHGNELAIALAGSNLWFVNTIQVGLLKNLYISAKKTNQNSIHFNLQYKAEYSQLTAEEEVDVIVKSQFCEPINCSLKVTKKLYEISARQEQLAKHKPSEVIELAFLSALLEQQLGERSKQSHKMKIIRKFLEEVVKLVPLESLFYALGCGDDDIIEDCCKALMKSDLPEEDFVPSEMLINGMSLALRRLTTGRRIHEHEFQRPYTFSDRIARMVLKTRHMLGYEENEATDSSYLWQTVTGRYAPMLYSEVTAGQQTPVRLSRSAHSGNHSSKCKPETKGMLPGQPLSHKQTKSKRVNRASSFERESTQKPAKHRTNKSTSGNYIIDPQVASLHFQPLLVYSHPFSVATDRNPNTSATKQKVIEYLREYLHSKDHICLNAISSVPISLVYPASNSSNFGGVMPPIDLLSATRRELEQLARKAVAAEKEEQDCLGHHGSSTNSPTKTKAKSSQKSETTLHNKKMLDTINSIRKKQKVCSILLGAFMEAQVRVPLVKSARDTAHAIGKTAIAVGVWALLSMPYFDLEPLLSVKYSSLIVEVTKFIHGTYFESNAVEVGDEYAGKLQFLLQGMVTTVSCNSRYISYSLEQQLQEQCDKLNISASTNLKWLIDKWETIFCKDVLSLVTPQSRELVARWLKWSLMVHNLREELAKYTSVGVIGLVNSGKSKLVSSLFNIPVPAGTRESKRTTIPFIYNLGHDLAGMDVIDYPGVDDRDETIPELAELLLSLAQIVVFVVDYKKAHTKATQEWLYRLAQENVYVLVCLTYADKLYAELMSKDGKHPNPDSAKLELRKQKELIADKLGQSPNRTVYLMTLSQDKDSVLNSDENRRLLLKVGLKCYYDVGDWLASTLESLQHNELAVKMTAFMQKKKKESKWYTPQ